MDTRRIATLALFVAALCTGGCADNCLTVALTGTLGTESREVGAFRSIAVSSNARVYVTVADSTTVRCEADVAVIPFMATEVVDGSLSISTRNAICSDAGLPMTVYVTMPAVDRVSMSSSGRVAISGAVVGDSLGLVMSGSGAIVLDAVTGKRLRANISGSGILSLSGSTALLDVECSGSGTMNSFDLASRRAAIDQSGSGTVRVTAQDELRVEQTGSGIIEYRGDPTLLEIHANGSGRVVHLR